MRSAAFSYTDDTYVGYIPAELKQWLNDNSPYAPDWMHVYQQWVELDKDLERTKEHFRVLYMDDTEEVYDSDHPQVNMPCSSGEVSSL